MRPSHKHTYIRTTLPLLKGWQIKCKYWCLLASVGFAALFYGASPALAQTILGTAQSFGVLGAQAVTNTGPTTITGDLGVSPGSSVTGFPPGIVLGTIPVNDAVATQAQSDATTAYNARLRACHATPS